MIDVVRYVFLFLVAVHGLIHLLGFIAYWPLAEISELPYKTALLGERWDIGETGMRLYSLLWLAAALGFVAAAVGLAVRQTWWYPLLWGVVLLSLLITALDWEQASIGAIASAAILVVLVLGLGLRIQPQPFAAYPERTAVLEQVPLPADLPAPVARFYHKIAGDQVPHISSAVISGRASLRFAGITFPARLRFTHDAGQGYRHYIEATYFGFPLMKVNEWYLDGRSRLELPVGVVENEPKVDMAAKLGLWGESIWLASIYVTDPRVRWEAAEIAERVAHVLQEAGFAVDVQPAEQVSDVAPHDAVVLGSAVYAGQWRKEAAAFLEANEKALAERPVWIFSSGPTGEADPETLMKGWRFPEALQPVADRIRPREIAVFGGDLDMQKLNLAEKLIIKVMRAPVGDFRDWDAIDGWAEGIAGALSAWSSKRPIRRGVASLPGPAP